MNTKEAREKSLQITGYGEKRQLAKIYTKIEEVTNRGKFECDIYYNVLPAVEQRLKNEGYTFSYTSETNVTITTISW